MKKDARIHLIAAGVGGFILAAAVFILPSVLSGYRYRQSAVEHLKKNSPVLITEIISADGPKSDQIGGKYVLIRARLGDNQEGLAVYTFDSRGEPQRLWQAAEIVQQWDKLK